MLTSKSSLSYVLCCNLVNISRRMESKVSFGIKISWAIRWLWKVHRYVLQKPRKWQKESGPSDMGRQYKDNNRWAALRLYVNNPPIHYDLRVRLLRDYKNFADLRFQFYALSSPLPLLWAAPHWHGSTGRCGNNSVSGQQVNDCFVGWLQWRRQCSETNHH